VDLIWLRHELEILAALVAVAAILRFAIFCLDDVLHAPSSARSPGRSGSRSACS
jgi:hypothetical protein